MERVGGGKLEESGCMMSAGGGYMTVPRMVPSSQAAINQSPTSTSLDAMDRFHPALMNPHYLGDSRRMKPESTHGKIVGIVNLSTECSK